MFRRYITHRRTDRPTLRRTGFTPLAAAFGASALLLSGCAAAGDAVVPSSSSPGQDAPERAADKLWSSEDQLIGDVAIAGDTVLGYVAWGTRTYLMARDLETGEQLWRTRVYRGTAKQYWDISPAVVEREGKWYGAAYRVNEYGAPYPALLSVETGQFLNSESPVEYGLSGNTIDACGGTFCFFGDEWGENVPKNREWTYDWQAAAWDFGGKPARLPTEGARFLSTFLFEDGQRPAEVDGGLEQLGYVVDGDVKWQRPYGEVFGSDFSSDAGWAWRDGEEDEAAATVIGEGHVTYEGLDENGTGEVTLHYVADRKTVGLDAATGETLWERPGAEMTCANGAGGLIDGTDLIVLCEFRSGILNTVHENWRRVSYEIVEPIRQQMVGVNRETGVVEWTQPMQDVTESDLDAESSGANILSSEGVRILEGPDGWLSIDPATGETQEAAAAIAPVTLCSERRDDVKVREFGDAYADYYDYDNPAIEVDAGTAYFACDRDTHEPVKEAPSGAEFTRVGYEEDGVAVLSGREGMTAYRLTTEATGED
ncbi:hypothetical protein GCM10027591_04520 [Zhihengliuella somnathii]